jgi:hypothetical protein
MAMAKGSPTAKALNCFVAFIIIINFKLSEKNESFD